MTLRGCSSSHFIWSIKDGEVRKVHNMNLRGRPSPKFKRLEEIYQHADAEYTSLHLAERKTRGSNNSVEEDEPKFSLQENNVEELTLSQIKKKLKRKKAKSVETILLTPKSDDDDDFDLTEPLCKFRVKASKSLKSKRVSANGNSPTSSRRAQLVTSEISKDLPIVKIKVEDPEVEYFESSSDMTRGKSPSFTNEGERGETNEALFDSLDDIKMEMDDEETIADVNQPSSILSSMANDSFIKDPTASTSDCSQSRLCLQQKPELENYVSAAQDSDPTFDDDLDEDMEAKPSISMEEDICELNEAFFDSLDDIENMEMDNEEVAANVNRPTTALSCLANGHFVKVPTASASECSQSQFCLQQTSEQVKISPVQDSTPTIDDEHTIFIESPISEENKKITSMNTDADSDTTPKTDDEHNEDVALREAKSPISEENKNLTSMNNDADSDTYNSDKIFIVSEDISIHQELISTVPVIADLEVKLDHNDKPSVMSEASEVRQPERLPLTRKFISPNSQEKLCQAMKSAESLDDMDRFKCKEKLYFGEQAEIKFLPTKSDVEDNELNLHSQQATEPIQNKAFVSSKQVLKRPRSFKKGSPTIKGIAPKGCLDGPRLCRSLPRLSSGCTSIEGCSESAIAFSQRQMHDIESLASKLLSELNSMKTIVEEKMLYEAYRSTSLKNEADEVKSVIKSATKTEETAKRWLSMMARDCNRFCKIMKLNEDHKASASVDPALGNSISEKPLEREKKKISFADEAGGTLCDIKVYQIEQESSLP